MPSESGLLKPRELTTRVFVYGIVSDPVPTLLDIEALAIRQGLLTCGWHYMIWPDGTYDSGRDLELCGVHAKEAYHNANSVGIAVFSKTGRFTNRQDNTLNQIIHELEGMYPELKEVVDDRLEQL